MRRVWKCPDCGSLVRLAVDVVATHCDSCGTRQWMNIESEPVLHRFVPPTENPDDISDGPPNSSAASVPNIFPRVQVTKSQKRKRGPRNRKKAANTQADKESATESPAAEATEQPEITTTAETAAETTAETTAENTAENTAETTANAEPSTPETPAPPSGDQLPEATSDAAPDSPPPSDTSDEPAAE